jgi:hypothetical protein
VVGRCDGPQSAGLHRRHRHAVPPGQPQVEGGRGPRKRRPG